MQGAWIEVSTGSSRSRRPAVAPSCRARGLKLVSKSLRHSHADGRTLMKGAGIEIGFGPLRSALSALRVQQKRGFGSLDRLGRRVFEVGRRVSGARSSVIWGFAAVPSRVRGLLVPKPRFCCTSPCENVQRGIVLAAAVGAGRARNGSHGNRKAVSTRFDAPFRLVRSHDPRWRDPRAIVDARLDCRNCHGSRFAPDPPARQPASAALLFAIPRAAATALPCDNEKLPGRQCMHDGGGDRPMIRLQR